MKKIVILIGILILSMVGYANAAVWVVLPVTNPGAETGNMSGWTTTTGVISSNAASPGPHIGGSYFFSTASSGQNTASMYQNVSVSSSYFSYIDSNSALYDVGVWYRTGTSGDNAIGNIYFLNAANTVIGSGTSGSLHSTTAWAQYDSGLLSTIPANTRTIRLELVGSNSSQNPKAYFDDVSLKLGYPDSTTTIPEPMSLSLLGIGLLGAIGAGFRKRK